MSISAPETTSGRTSVPGAAELVPDLAPDLVPDLAPDVLSDLAPDVAELSTGPTSVSPTPPETHVASTTVQTPDGDFTIVAADDAVLASGWTVDVPSLVVLIHPSFRPRVDDVVHTRANGASSVLEQAVAAVAAYYDGDLEAPGRIPVRQQSGEFRMHAWDVLREVDPGHPITYAEYAARSGRPAAIRAAAGACALNAAALFVPCHRVLRTDGSLGGFRYGLAIKERLLDREAAPAR
jgi:methylated-DNA-[protein]-cysteine S-methyltransferase